MATITLQNGNQYLLAVNGWNKSHGVINMVVLATDEPTEQIKEVFTGNEEITMRDASIHITAQGFVCCRSIERVNDYPVGGMDAHGDDILADVWKISLADTEQTEEEQTEEEPQTEEEQVITSEEDQVENNEEDA